MQGPPDRKAPPVLFARGTSEWINRVSQKHKQLADLRLSAERREILDRWVETEFVYSTLKLEGVDISRENVAQIVSDGAGASADVDDERVAVDLLAALRAVTSLARTRGKSAELTRELLLTLHSQSGSCFRQTAGDENRAIRPPSPNHLPALLESACRWYTAESFAELNPIEQASIVLLRLIELQPFEEGNQRTALAAASLFMLRSELPPIIIKPEKDSSYRSAIEEGFRMNTKPMVETVAEAVEETIEGMIAASQR